MKRNFTSEHIFLVPPVSPTKVIFFFFFLIKFIEWRNNHMLHHYRPQRSYGKVMFLHLSVILFTGGCVSQHALGLTTHRQTYPSMHWGRHPPQQTYPSQPPPGETATATDGTHPTGMHLCWENDKSSRRSNYTRLEIPRLT